MDESNGSPRLDADIQSLRRRLPSLEAVERRRRRLWLLVALLLVLTSGLVTLLLVSPDAADGLPDSTALRAAIGIVSVAFVGYVLDQDRRLRQLASRLLDERMLSSALNERVRDLSTLSRIGQVVNSVLTTDEVLQIILRGARELTGAVKGSVMLVDRATDELVVEVATGSDAAPLGARQPLHTGVAGHVAETREALLITGDVSDTQVEERRPRRRPGGSSVIAPMIANEQVVGILALERELGESDFDQWELRAVSLFANHAATAVTNAQRYEEERDNVSRLADMIERRSDVVATLVQDLKGPLTAILGDTRLLSTRGEVLGAGGRREAVTRIELASEDLLDMIDEILDSASFEQRDPAGPVTVELGPLLDDLVAETQTMAASRDGQPRAVRLRIAQGATFVTDPRSLRTVLENLLENAVKYSPPGTPIEVDARMRDGALQITVTDQGRGIPEEEQEQIFDRFRRRDGSGPAAEGAGLGLYIARSLVQAQGGRIEVESTPDTGSAFRVVLPEPDVDAPPPPPPPPPAADVDLAPPTPPDGEAQDDGGPAASPPPPPPTVRTPDF